MRITLTIDDHPKGGYLIRYPNGAYDTCNVDIRDPRKATQFKDYIAVSRYLEQSYPYNGAWLGKWEDNEHYSIEVS